MVFQLSPELIVSPQSLPSDFGSRGHVFLETITQNIILLESGRFITKPDNGQWGESYVHEFFIFNLSDGVQIQLMYLF